MGITKEIFGRLGDGRPVHLYTLANGCGMTVRISDYGGIVVALEVPDVRGRRENVVLGYDALAPYLENPYYFGAIIGRYANRIARGRFTIGGTAFQVSRNEGRNHLHGGRQGFHNVLWEAADTTSGGVSGLRLRYRSPHGDEGYPGTLTVTVHYGLQAEHTLRIDYQATSDRPTPVNLTHHSYFNLAGAGSDSILAHEIQILARHFTPLDEELIPTGEIRPVAGTPLDFTTPRIIGDKIDTPFRQLRIAGGYDHNWVLDSGGTGLNPAVRVRDPASGRRLEMHTTAPGVQFYTGNSLPHSLRGREGRIYSRRGGFCLEAQHFPDAPNQPRFPPALLMPGHTYTQTTVYQFSAD